MSFIDEYEQVYLASRLERLSEHMKKAGARILKSYLPVIKYKWYPVLHALDKKKSISVVELATELSYAHPTIIDILKEMEEDKLIKSTTDKNDNRKRLLSLTPKGSRLVEKVVPITKAFIKTVNDIVNNDHHLLKAIRAVEDRLEDEAFFNRVNKILKHEITAA